MNKSYWEESIMRRWTTEEVDFVLSNHDNMSAKDMANKIDRTVSSIQSIIRYNKINKKDIKIQNGHKMK